MLLLMILRREKQFKTFDKKVQPEYLESIVEERHRIFWWNDAFFKLPLHYLQIRLQIIGIWFRSYTLLLKNRIRFYKSVSS